jgi:hypothetical protein
MIPKCDRLLMQYGTHVVAGMSFCAIMIFVNWT